MNHTLGGLQQQKCTFSWFWGWTSAAKVSAAPAPSEGSKEDPSLPVSLRWPQATWCSWLWHSAPCLCLHVAFSVSASSCLLSLKRTLIAGFRTDPSNTGRSHLEILNYSCEDFPPNAVTVTVPGGQDLDIPFWRPPVTHFIWDLILQPHPAVSPSPGKPTASRGTSGGA